MSEAELFYLLSEDRLRRRCVWAGAAIAASVLLPYEVIDNQPQFIWQLFGELPASGVVAGLAPLVAGAAIIAARHVLKRAASLAIAVLAALISTALCHKLGADASAWGLLPLPSSFTTRGGFALVALGLTAAGSSLAHRPTTRTSSRVLLVGAAVAAMTFYAWPGRGEAPGVTVLNSLALLGDMPNLRFKVGLVTLAIVALWPALLALLGLVQVVRPPARSFSGLSMAALMGFPLILMMLLLSWYMRASPGSALFGAAGTTLEIAAVLALVAGSAEVLGEVMADPGDVPMPNGWAPAKAAALSATVLLLVASAQWWLARPPDKGISWSLAAPNDAGDRLFGELVVHWSDARWVWRERVRSDSSATELLEVKRRGKAMTDAGRAIDGQLGDALDALASAAWQLNTSSRSWYRLVAEVNAACRAAGLPYYLDPRVSIRTSKDGLRRSFLVDSYRVTRVRRWTVDDKTHATLHVNGFGTLRGGHRLSLLGFSRDVQPFALVVINANEAHLDALRDFASHDPPHCGQAFDREQEQASRRCGAVLAELLAKDDAIEAATAKVERHELQHQIDGPLLPLAKPVLRKLAGYTDEAQDRVNRELSAYIAQLTVTSHSAKLGLVVPFRFALLNDRGNYHHAAVLMFEALGQRRVRTIRGVVDPVGLTDVFDELNALDDQALRAQAAQTWEALFGGTLADVRAIDDTVAPPQPTGS